MVENAEGFAAKGGEQRANDVEDMAEERGPASHALPRCVPRNFALRAHPSGGMCARAP